MKMLKYMYFWLNYSDKTNHLEKRPVAVKNISHLFGITWI